MTRVHLIYAGPTPWDLEDRLVGGHSLPLTTDAESAIGDIASALREAPTSVYRSAADEAADRAARIIAERFSLRPRDCVDLSEVGLGLWEGLNRDELRFRFPSIFPQWEDHPLSVLPPEGEPLEDAIKRLSGAAKKIFRRNRGAATVLVLRPMSLQIVAGALRGESNEIICGHLHAPAALETIELT
jgi:broad specificity phosphatase PhoE